ncbi:MAG: hypothetical protein WBG27_05330, partial [Candidatus Aquilonibacter sp.]
LGGEEFLNLIFARDRGKSLFAAGPAHADCDTPIDMCAPHRSPGCAPQTSPGPRRGITGNPRDRGRS